MSDQCRDFQESESSGGLILIFCTIFSLVAANSLFGDAYTGFWQAKAGFVAGGKVLSYSIVHWINDGLMAVFFLMIGLEIERELYVGELSDPKNAVLPIFAAVGGMALPAFFHYLFNRGLETQAGIGIPMATDIAFALGALSLLGRRAPVSLKIFLTALAIIDDLGAIIIIAIFYTGDFSLAYFLMAIGIFAGLLLLNRMGVHRLAFYLIPGVAMCFFMHESGVHATISGVLLAFVIPFARGVGNSPSNRLQRALHGPVAYVILPLFALANTGIALSGDWAGGLASANSMGILAGLFAGKPAGIFLLSFLAVKSGLARLPGDLSWKHVLGAGFLGGIGFTMSIFITLLAFEDPELVQISKISVLLGSLLAGLAGLAILRIFGRENDCQGG
ncbi:MAG: Na+/H+ antiporter NhaA [Deltaproteobacteria bacterium]|nr:Na+/H+ antiporter NhaA [Deltaproteobacteria bacterium]